MVTPNKVTPEVLSKPPGIKKVTGEPRVNTSCAAENLGKNKKMEIQNIFKIRRATNLVKAENMEIFESQLGKVISFFTKMNFDIRTRVLIKRPSRLDEWLSL